MRSYSVVSSFRLAIKNNKLSYNLIKMISGFSHIFPVLSSRALAKRNRKVKNTFSHAIGKATLQRSLKYKVICQLVIVNGQWCLPIFLKNYLTKTGKYVKTFLARPSG